MIPDTKNTEKVYIREDPSACKLCQHYTSKALPCPGFPGQGDRRGSFAPRKQCDYERCVLAKADTGAG
jgi:hypothetical protein